MAKILKVEVNYPDEESMRTIQEKAMKILADYLVKELPPEAIKQIIERLEKES